jgi:hypothetical protein
MLRRILPILILLALVGLHPDAQGRGKPRAKEGDYNINVGGYVSGNGVAVVSSGKVKLQANVVNSESGAGGELNASNLTLNGAHFTGTGNILGEQFIFRGRLDFPDPDEEKAIKGVRLVGTFHSADYKKYGRVVGFIPALANAPDPDRNKHPTGSSDDKDKNDKDKKDKDKKKDDENSGSKNRR